jgi:transcriptional regulator with XRE-family HTH domain
MTRKEANQAFGQVLSQFRARAGKTQAQTAEALGVDPATIANWENARAEPRASHVMRLALFFGIQVVDLFQALTDTLNGSSPVPPPPESYAGPITGSRV